jgi:hypothetical protein
LQEIEKRTQKIITQEQKERIFKREEEQFYKKHEKIISKQLEREQQQLKMEQLQAKLSKGLKEKVESKLTAETRAMKDKKREKFDATKEKGRDAMTMGGNLLGIAIRAMPQWR